MATRKETDKIFDELDVDQSKRASKDEIASFVAKQDQLWARLSRKLHRPEEECQVIATRVAMELASGLSGQAALNTELTKDQFYYFRRTYMLDTAGSEEFFQRAMFANFDADNSGELDEEELGVLIDMIYESSRFFDLPPKDKLLEKIKKRWDVDGDNKFSFQEVRSIIVGGAAAVLALADVEDEESSTSESESASEEAEDEQDFTEGDRTEEVGDMQAEEKIGPEHTDIAEEKPQNTSAEKDKKTEEQPQDEPKDEMVPSPAKKVEAEDPRQAAAKLLMAMETPKERAARASEESESEESSEEDEETGGGLTDRGEGDEEARVRAEEQARKEEEERSKAEAREQARREQEEIIRLEEEEKEKRWAALNARKDAEEKAKREAEERFNKGSGKESLDETSEPEPPFECGFVEWLIGLFVPPQPQPAQHGEAQNGGGQLVVKEQPPPCTIL